jgi:hypothetical protein
MRSAGSTITVEAVAEAKVERTPKPAWAEPNALSELKAPGLLNETASGVESEVEAD